MQIQNINKTSKHNSRWKIQEKKVRDARKEGLPQEPGQFILKTPSKGARRIGWSLAQKDL